MTIEEFFFRANMGMLVVGGLLAIVILLFLIFYQLEKKNKILRQLGRRSKGSA